mmetsp:Transcript_15335/g.22960  ORF Transcript_15335/g.22960 Transcript_15335/m.22960 type:complete len:174 (+) Transcript_15335:44-565(+)|eukprot:CAMPEP_0201552732 /NCGR_PEP_ID=MMETSP0173_2-20130828/17137_1 /ASSEMBLY_ACC=CAM_ASM_000268 /TAXON_ID=218659 /ORGANISM="Vexillifera sp., Strain DIVA3 564/2" /LENGTH=173 /DNA_ID=CAMNT_0047963257 /DNA_START=41 /DNA_END=562 /DNA_ORIENTATION=-
MAAKHNNVWHTYPNVVEMTKRLFAEVQKHGVKDVFSRYMRYHIVRPAGTLVGKDSMGNKYYENQEYKMEILQRRYRWVEYARDDYDGSHVAPEWHGWLHYTNDIVPGTPEAAEFMPKYHRSQLPSQTGTDQAYFPPNHPLNPNWKGPKTRVQFYNPPDQSPPPTDAEGQTIDK